MMRSAGTSIVIALLVLTVTRAHPSHAAVTDAELSCQAGTAKAMGKQTVARSKCIAKCHKGARAGKYPATDCIPGSYSGATLQCVDAAEEKAAAGEVSKCKQDCPECYDGDGTCAPGDCVCDSENLSEEVANAIDLYAGYLYCDDSSSADGLNADEAKCEDAATKVLSKFVVTRLKCFDKCHDAEHAGKIAAGSCASPPSDPDAIHCLAGATAQAAVAIDKVCAPAGGDRPECYPFDGAGWASVIGSVVDGYDAEFFCSE